MDPLVHHREARSTRLLLHPIELGDERVVRRRLLRERLAVRRRPRLLRRALARVRRLHRGERLLGRGDALLLAHERLVLGAQLPLQRALGIALALAHGEMRGALARDLESQLFGVALVVQSRGLDPLEQRRLGLLLLQFDAKAHVLGRLALIDAEATHAAGSVDREGRETRSAVRPLGPLGKDRSRSRGTDGAVLEGRSRRRHRRRLAAPAERGRHRMANQAAEMTTES